MTVVASNLCQRKCSLTIAGSAVAESATYAVLLSGSGDATKFGTRLPDELFTLAQADGGDICFTSDAAGLNPLPVEIVSILAGSKQAEIWVAVPLTAATATTIYVWYQSTGSTLAQPAASATYGSQAVWNGPNGVGNMVAVYHFGTPTAWSGADSTSNNIPVVPSGTPTAAAGQMGGSFNVAGTHMGYRQGSTSLPQGTAARTLQTWFQLTSSAANQCLGGWGEAGSGTRFEVIFDSPNGWQIDVDGAGTSLVSPWTYDTNWHSVTATSPAGNANLTGCALYLDGVNKPITGSGAFNTQSTYQAIGQLCGVNNYYYQGLLDEYRVSSAARSANFIATDQAIQSSTTLVTVGTPRGTGPQSLSAGDTLTVSDTASCYKATKHASAADHVASLSDAAAARDFVHCPRATDTLISLRDTAYCHDNKQYPVLIDKCPLIDEAFVHNATAHLAAVSTLAVTDTAVCYNTVHHITAVDPISLVESDYDHPAVRRVSASDALSIVETARALFGRPKYATARDGVAIFDTANKTHGTIRVAAVDVLCSSYPVFNADTSEFVTVYTGLQDSASALDHRGGIGGADRLPLRDVAHCLNVRADAKTAAASDSLTLSDHAIKSRTTSALDTLVLSDTAHVNAGYPTGDMLLVGDRASVNVVRLLHAQDTLVVEQSFFCIPPLAYPLVKRDYSPSIGVGTSNNPAPPPAALVFPSGLGPGEFTLLYPATGTPTDTLVLRKPEFGNKDRLQFNRISRETRGGTLVVYADPMWPKTQNLVLTFSALKPTQAKALTTFLANHLGQQIGLWDWEGRHWTGIVTNPNDPVVQDSKYSYTGSLEFEGQLV